MASKPKPSRHAPEEIDAYLAAQPQAVRATLERLRVLIRAAAPDCTERVSYQIPVFRLGKDLVGISAQKDHCSLHTMSPALVASMQAATPGALEGVKVSGATVHFVPGEPLPEALVAQIVAARLAEIQGGAA